MENTVNTQEILEAVQAGEAVIKTSSIKGKVITGGIAVAGAAGALIGGIKIGQKIERNKFEDRIAALESAMYGDEYFEEEEESDEDDFEEEAPAKKKPKKASKPEKVEGEVED